MQAPQFGPDGDVGFGSRAPVSGDIHTLSLKSAFA